MNTKPTASSLQTVNVSSISQFIKIVCSQRDEWIAAEGDFRPWFRGQSSAEWGLEPNIFRHGLLGSEGDLRGEFERCAQQYMTEATPRNHWGWYFLMQHYGAPTRLLDWSDGALIALFFAVTSRCHKEGPEPDAAVWMLDPWWLNRKTLKLDSILDTNFKEAAKFLREDPYPNQSTVLPDYVAAIDPPFIARRVAVQRGHFTVFGKNKNALEDLGKRRGARLIKIVINSRSLAIIRRDLETFGISQTSIYPDLQGLAEELITFWKRP